MSATAIHSESTAPTDRPTEDHFPWELEAAPSVVESDTWLLSFIDILTLLLALFVLLLAQEYQSNKTGKSESVIEPAKVIVKPEPLPLKSLPELFSAIRLPALPQIVTPLSRLQTSIVNRPQKAPKATQTLAPAEKRVVEDPVEPTSEFLVNTTAHSRVNDLLESLRNSELADRIDIQTRTNSVRLDIADSILFAPARTKLTDSGLSLLKSLAATLNTLLWSLSVEGHTDNVPIQTERFPSNWELSAARATIVARELIRHGIRPDRIRAIGYADTLPRASNKTAKGRNRNRRVTFVLELPAGPGSHEKI